MEFVISEGLSLGLRRDSRQQRNSQELVSLSNLIPTEWGLKTVPAVTYPLSSPALSMSWPHPQILNGEYFRVLANKTALSEIDTGALTASALSFVDAATLTTSNNVWDLASFQTNIWFMTNVTNFVYRIPSNTDGDAAIGTTSTVNALCSHEGRLVLGGLGGTPPATLTAFFNEWKELDHYRHCVVGSGTTLGDNWIVYSELGGGARDQPFRPFMSMLALPSAPTDDMTVVIRDALEAGEIGFFPLKKDGAILKLLPLGNDLMVYAENGISRLRMTENGYIEQPILDFGIQYRGLAGGDRSNHIAITEQSGMFRFSASGEVERLNYKEYMDTLTLSSTVICHDSDENFFTISDNNNGFTLTRTGLAATDGVLPASLVRMPGYDGLAGTHVTASDPQAAHVLTEIFDGGDRQVWELQYVAIATTDTTSAGWQIQVDWRLNKDDNWTRTTAVAVDDRGRARVKVSGIEFRIYLSAANRKQVDLERIEAELRRGGMRKLANIT